MEVLMLLRILLSWLFCYARYGVWLRHARPTHAEGLVEADDISIYFHRYGSGETVLLLHGGFMRMESWVGQIPALASGYHVVAMDSRGHGRTSLGTRSITYRQMASDAAALIERLDVGPVHLVGSSDGGCTSLALAIERPDLVRSIVLIGTPFNTENYEQNAWDLIEEVLHPGSHMLLGLKLLRGLNTPEPYRWPEFLQRMRKMWIELPDFTREELSRIKAPALVLACDRDEFLSHRSDPLAVFRETAEALPNASIAFIPRGTHSVQIEHPGKVNRIFLDFLREVRTGTLNPG